MDAVPPMPPKAPPIRRVINVAAFPGMARLNMLRMIDDATPTGDYQDPYVPIGGYPGIWGNRRASAAASAAAAEATLAAAAAAASRYRADTEVMADSAVLEEGRAAGTALPCSSGMSVVSNMASGATAAAVTAAPATASAATPNAATPQPPQSPPPNVMICFVCGVQQEAPARNDQPIRFCVRDGPPARCENCCTCEQCTEGVRIRIEASVQEYLQECSE